MNVQKAFEKFLANLRIADTTKISRRYKSITKLLNRKYWDSDSETANSLQVGSYGRGTATEGISDLDMIMTLPPAVKNRIDKHEGNGQSALLQEVKNAIKATYPSTDISGNGQVVAVKMIDFTIEVLPAFERTDGSFLFPDTTEGGSWKKTDPRAEIAAINSLNKKSDGNLKSLCRMTRAWKDKAGVSLPGLLIDALAYNFLDARPKWHAVGFDSFPELVASFFDFLGSQDPEQAFWLAPGSQQRVYKKGPFTRKAKTAARKCREAIKNNEDTSVADEWRDIFGRKFPSPAQLGDRSAASKSMYENTEEYIEDSYPVSICATVSIDCEVTQAGFRSLWLTELLRRRWPLKQGKRLRFFVTRCSAPGPYSIKWKVRNIGPEAERRDKIRGEIVHDDGRAERVENTRFYGPHYVECYVIKDGICIARDRIEVPISTESDAT